MRSPILIEEVSSIGCTVVILDKQYRKRAEATIVRFELAGKTESGMQRYNVHFKDAQETIFIVMSVLNGGEHIGYRFLTACTHSRAATLNPISKRSPRDTDRCQMTW